MDVVGHEYERMHRHGGDCRRRTQILEVCGIVAGVEKARLAVDAADDDVLGHTRDIDARQARHGGRGIQTARTRLAACRAFALRSIRQMDDLDALTSVVACGVPEPGPAAERRLT